MKHTKHKEPIPLVLGMHVTQEEKAMIEAEAKGANLAVSELLRRKLGLAQEW